MAKTQGFDPCNLGSNPRSPANVTFTLERCSNLYPMVVKIKKNQGYMWIWVCHNADSLIFKKIKLVISTQTSEAHEGKILTKIELDNEIKLPDWGVV